MQTNSIERNFLFTLLIASIIFTLIILYPFLSVIVLASAFAVVLNPIYEFIKKNITRGVSWIASLLSIIIFIGVLCIPLLFAGSIVFKQAQDAYISIVQTGNSSTFIDKINISINKILPSGSTFDAHSKITDLISFLMNNVTNIFTSTLDSVIKLFLIILTLFYLLKDGLKWKKNLVQIMPISNETGEEILSKLTVTINNTIKGTFFIAIVQGIFTTTGFMMFGIPNPALWGVVAGLASFIPTIGTAMVTVPAIIYLYLNGMSAQAFGLFLWSALLVGMIDNIMGPYVISKNTEIPSLFILFSILGGLSFMGAIGIFIGPLVLSMLYALVGIYRKQEKVA